MSACRLLTVMPACRVVPVEEGTLLSDALRDAGFAVPLPCGGHGICGKCGVSVRTSGGEARVVPACRTRVLEDLEVQLPADAALADAPLPCQPPSAPDAALGVAVDLGTTAVAVLLSELNSGRRLGAMQFVNPQRCAGDDVLSRIAAIQRDPAQLAFLRGIVGAAIAAAVRKVCGDCGAEPSRIRRYAVAGNSAMQEIFLGISPEALGCAPFAPAFTAAQTRPLSSTPLPGADGAELYVFPQPGGFVGGDTVAGLLAFGEPKARTLFVDLGTNAEIALIDGAALAVTSAAAGPAIEGATLGSGMLAMPGAISGVKIDSAGKPAFCTIGNAKPVGICGSGYVALLAALLESGVVDREGAFADGRAEFALAPNATLTQEDVRKLQLAKGAICAGIETLLAHTRTPPESIEEIAVAGGLGGALDPAAARRIGLFPKMPNAEWRTLGNASLAGAEMMLSNADAPVRAEKIRRTAESFNLAELPEFNGAFIRALDF